MLSRVSALLSYIGDCAFDAGRCRWTIGRGGVSPGRFLYLPTLAVGIGGLDPSRILIMARWHTAPKRQEPSRKDHAT